MAAPDYFLKIDGPSLKGESKADGHKDEIQLYEFSWTEAQEGTGGGTSKGGTAGKVRMQDLVVKMETNTASPELFLACANGKHFDSAVLTCRKASDKPQDFLKWTFSDVIVTGYTTVGKEVTNNGETTVHPLDEVRFSFKKIKVEYKPLENKQLGAAVTAGWDLVETKKL